jgi:putative N6-adenine-specific DNA methylase
VVRRPLLDCFAASTPGLEQITAAELEALGLRVRVGRGGVGFRGTTRQLYAANLHLRTANRVLVRVGSFSAYDFAALEQGVAAIDWSPWVSGAVAVRAASHASTLFHTGAIEERVLDAIGGSREHEEAAQLVLVRVDHDVVTISVDASGEHLHRRGWRRVTAKAPLRETLAAAVLMGCGWDGSVPLVDPCCGSGTIAIEAALIARARAAGTDRAFAFQRWPSFEAGTWASVAGAARAAERTEAGVAVVAADRDPGAVAATIANAERAGVVNDLEVRRAAVSDLTLPPAPGFVVTNPPYGERVASGRGLFATLGAVLRERGAGWRVAMLVPDERLVRPMGLQWREQLRAANGGIGVRLLTAAVWSPDADATRWPSEA